MRWGLGNIAPGGVTSAVYVWLRSWLRFRVAPRGICHFWDSSRRHHQCHFVIKLRHFLDCRRRALSRFSIHHSCGRGRRLKRKVDIKFQRRWVRCMKTCSRISAGVSFSFCSCARVESCSLSWHVDTEKARLSLCVHHLLSVFWH